MFKLIQKGIQAITDYKNLTSKQATSIMQEILSGVATQAQTSAFITALKIKGETIEEITAFAQVLKKNGVSIKPNIKKKIIDTCGTGGDISQTFNISTCTAFVLAGSGICVAKHGNRSVTSNCGSADLLEGFGLKLNTDSKQIEKSIEEIGIGFLYAPIFHPTMKYVAPIRKEIGIRTVFNILGPLINPANVKQQIMGVYNEKLVEQIIYVLKNLELENAMVVHGLDGLDELSIIGKTKIGFLKNSEIIISEIDPKKIGLPRYNIKEIQTVTKEENIEIAFKILNGNIKNGGKLDSVLLNSSAGLLVTEEVDDIKYGIEKAREVIQSGKAYMKLKQLIKFCSGNTEELEKLEKKYD